MLYISRCVGMGKYGVVDTDDGVETICEHSELWEYCVNMGIDVKGVVLQTTMVRNRPKLSIHHVEVYQGAETTKGQLKMKLFQGIDVKTYNGEIVAFDYDPNLVPQGIQVRLSEFGSKCGEYLFKRGCYTDKIFLTIILDDNIVLHGKSFKYFYERGVALDIREVRSKRTIGYICRELCSKGINNIKLDKLVIDHPARMEYYRGEILLHCGPPRSGPVVNNIADLVQNAEEVNRLVTKKHRAEFKSVAAAQFVSNGYDPWGGKYKDFAQWLKRYKHYIELPDYDLYIGSRMHEIVPILAEVTTSNKSVLLRFQNYVTYFNVEQELKDAYVQVCQSGGRFYLSYARRMGWI